MKKWRIRGYTPLHKNPVEIVVQAPTWIGAKRHKRARGFCITSIVLIEE